MDGISSVDAAPGAAQVAMLRKVLDAGSQNMANLLEALPQPVPPTARPGEYLA
ncbi:putative motility protein YjfB-like [Motilibacter peucedani]|uniref:Putative motility protein YjfB-like n=1 Tax=Motilibacter peucedani TaxID=598650 RepID=A0A420XSV3_9ACTN|nr:putative motility protein [Motilibacter peucedani]RKS77910.1 putative motility protein YjfB-like [Motilibacter peucedani]